MTTTKGFSPRLASEVMQESSVHLDEKTGLPKDYYSFVVAYRPLLLNTTERARIPEVDREDAVQELQQKFWAKDGLAMFDPTMGKQFATFLHAWASKFVLQERDKSIKKNSRFVEVDPDEFRQPNTTYTRIPDNVDSVSDLVTDERIRTWLHSAESVLEQADALHLLPLLRLCVEAAETGSKPSRAAIAEATGCKLYQASDMLKQLRTILTNNGFGVQSLYD